MTRVWTTAAVLLAVAGLGLDQSSTAATASAPPARATAPAALSVEPSAGASGTLVTIGADLTQAATACTLAQDGTSLEKYECGPNRTIQFTVTGAPGPHTLTLCAPTCSPLAAGATATASAVFTVLAAAPELVVVPRLIGLRRSAVARALSTAGLKLADGTGSAGDVVVSQDPPAGTSVAVGTAVTVTLRSRVIGRFVAVPDLRGQSVDNARRTLAGVGLVLSSPANSGTVATQDLLPGRRVAAGATVTVTIELIAPPTSVSTKSGWAGLGGWWWVIAPVVMLALAFAALVARFTVRRIRRDRTRPRSAAGPPPRVTCRTDVDVVHTRATGPTAPTVELRIREHATLTMERKP